MTGLLAVDRYDVADFVDTLVIVYIVLIFIHIIVSWVPRMPYNRYLAAFLKFVDDVVNPYLNLWRRVLPTARLGGAGLDLSPMVGSVVLILVGSIVSNAIRG